jgi:hypothetical protein
MPATISAADQLRFVLEALDVLGMVAVPGSPAANDPLHVRAMATASRSLPIPMHFAEARPVYLLSATPLGGPIR